MPSTIICFINEYGMCVEGIEGLLHVLPLHLNHGVQCTMFIHMFISKSFTISILVPNVYSTPTSSKYLFGIVISVAFIHRSIMYMERRYHSIAHYYY